MLKIAKTSQNLIGQIVLDGSKSISNRALLIGALCTETLVLTGLSQSNDTKTMASLLGQNTDEYHCGDAGTTARFTTAWLAFRAGSQVLTGSARMQERPIGALIDALRALGANIEYLRNDGYLPIRLDAPTLSPQTNEVQIAADVSSQFISALLMLGPTLPTGLRLVLVGDVVSRPYIEMTLGIMSHFGIEHNWTENIIEIAAQKYISVPFNVEADWSAASYWYGLAALTEGAVDVTLHHLQAKSLQGDSVVTDIFAQFGIKTEFGENQVRLTKSDDPVTELFEYDFVTCPDIAQTLAVVCGGLGVQGLFSGLETLPIKETDRIAAMDAELGRLGVFLSKLPQRFSSRKPKQYYLLEGNITPQTEPPVFETYGDHRMAMSLAMLAAKQPVVIRHPQVVAKSYPAFWDDMTQMGFDVGA